MERTWIFVIEHAGEPGAGILPYSDRLLVRIESGDPGGKEGEFSGHIRECLEDWFDGARVADHD